ncbi:hypothetical protein CIB48_g9444 [Xylaria polymorpha]|nr:hypothetical protein CIB48_g9444 [Xylaria polymorpha]
MSTPEVYVKCRKPVGLDGFLYQAHDAQHRLWSTLLQYAYTESWQRHLHWWVVVLVASRFECLEWPHLVSHSSPASSEPVKSLSLDLL